MPEPGTAASRAAAAPARSGVKSPMARSMALTLLDAPRAQRRQFLRSLSETDMAQVFLEVERETGTRYAIWHDDPYGFTQDVLNETMWGLQRGVMESIVAPAERIVVPAGFGVGKTWLAGRMVAWAGAVNPIGSIKIVTTATRERQVKTQLWPHIKTAVAKGSLPGRTDSMQWVAEDKLGNLVQVAYGFSAPPNDEAAMQGIHGVPKLLLIIDEAGGIASLIGNSTNNFLTGDAKMLAIGNPAMDEPGSWFERLSDSGENPEELRTHRVQISTLDSPAITGEPTPVCTACVPNLDGHTISEGANGQSHLPDWNWLFNTLEEYGLPADRNNRDVEVVRSLILESGHPYLVAKVLAEFPKASGNQVIPAGWTEAAIENEDPEGEEWVRLCDLGLATEPATHTVKRGSPIKLGVDVAADGGDEFTIYRLIGDVIEKRHASAGNANADPNAVAEKVLEEIEAAQRLAAAIGSTHQIRVKVDQNGLGWGVVGNLVRWFKSGRHQAKIIGVMVSESPFKDDPAAVMRPYRKRDEMWLAGRFLLAPDPSTGFPRVRLRIDHQAKVQMGLPRLESNAAGYTQVESKKKMKARGASSPDRAEGLLLAIYEPEPVFAAKRFGLLN